MDSIPIRQFLLKFQAAKIDLTLSSTKLFFIVGMGRSGTVFLANLLNTIPQCAVYHEISADRNALVEAYWNTNNAFRYLSTDRRRLIAARIRDKRCHTYGEVNSYLRYHVSAIRQIFDAKALHLVRDGREVVRSMMNRTTFTPKDKNHSLRLMPKPDDPHFTYWNHYDRFQRVCWYWTETNTKLLEHNLPLIRFEDILSSYESFSEQVLERLDLWIEYQLWRQQVSNPKNASSITQFPGWNQWTHQQKHQFEVICGDVMTKLGYNL